MPTKRKSNPPPQPAVPLDTSELSELSDELTADVLRACSNHLDEKPSPEYVIGKYKTSPQATTWREYLMWAMLRIRDKHGHLRALILNRAQQDLERRSTSRNIVLKA